MPELEDIMNIESFFDKRTWTWSYVVYDTATKDAVVIDPVLDYEPASSRTWTESVDQIVEFLQKQELNLRLIVETHAHADHLSGSQMIREKFPAAKLGIGERITEVQAIFKDVFSLPEDFPTDGRQFDVLLKDREVYQAGSLAFEVMNTPGHTPACVCLKFGNDVFTGDAIFQPDIGTGRCDFPGGSAVDLYNSISRRLYGLPDDTVLHVGHDYPPQGRSERATTTVAEQKASNVQLRAGTTEKEFVQFREARDATLSAPRLLFQSVQVNVDAGALPKPEANSRRYLKIPINAFRPDGDGEIAEQDVKK
jgi:glyoxylase-like metal-dependent hydrolase (beta-lactamase superfamily II)